jgi:hypothetical protein
MIIQGTNERLYLGTVYQGLTNVGVTLHYTWTLHNRVLIGGSTFLITTWVAT